MVSIITIFSALAAAGGGLGYFMFPAGLKFGIENMINLKEDGMVYPLYMKPPFPSNSRYWIYAITNPRDVLRGGKMEFTLKGPYVYSTYIERDNVSFTEKDARLRYDSHRKLYLEEGKSANLDEKMWLVNPTLMNVQGQVKSIILDRVPFPRVVEPIVFNAVNALLDNFKERLIFRRTPRELLQGKPIELLESVGQLASRFGLQSFVPPGPPENVFGLAHYQNNSVDPFEIWTGIGAAEKFGDVYAWKGARQMRTWKGQCNTIAGTNGELYKPFVEKGKPQKIFLSQLCRTFDLTPVSDGEYVQVQDGLMALEYELNPRLFQGARNNPRNKCYCLDARTYDCQYDGLVSMSPCFFDTPLYFSRANFKGVDRRIRSLINEDTINFNLPDKQSFYIEPTTGTVLKANLSLLALFKIVRQPYMRDLAKVQNLTYAPLFQASEDVELPTSVTWQLLALQKMTQYYKPANVIMALAGSGALLMKFLTRGSRSSKVGSPSTEQLQPAAIEQQLPKESVGEELATSESRVESAKTRTTTDSVRTLRSPR